MRTNGSDGGISTSLWAGSCPPDSVLEMPGQPPADTEVAIIGAGIAGLTTALELIRRGTRVTVLDDGPIGGGETGRSSAHLTSEIDDRYHVLEAKLGARSAAIVAESHMAAIDEIEANVRELEIDCELRRVDGYLFAPPGHRSDHELERELAAASRAGLVVERVTSAPLPFDTGPALRFARQAEINPLKYVCGLARAVSELGGTIVTGVHVHEIDPGRPVTLRLDGDRRVTCRVAVDATNGALSSPVKLALRQAAYRTYVIAFDLAPGAIPHALYWDTADPYHYLRLARGTQGREVLVVGGCDHRTGQGDPAGAFAELESWVRRWIPVAGAIVTRWSGQIIEPVDGIAHIGKSPGHDNVFVVSGDSGEGLTHGTIAGVMLPELIRGNRPGWADVYDPDRRHHALGTLVKEATQSSLPYADWLQRGDASSPDEIPPDEGAVLRRGLHLIACYRDPSGTLHERSAACPHLRGVVRWNGVEKTWDCPCHGSRFDPYGRVVNGPAPHDLLPVTRGPGPRRPAPEPLAPLRTERRAPVTPPMSLASALVDPRKR